MPLQRVVDGRRGRLPAGELRHALVDRGQPGQEGLDLAPHAGEHVLTAAQERGLVAAAGAGVEGGGAQLGEGHQLKVDLVLQLTGLEKKKVLKLSCLRKEISRTSLTRSLSNSASANTILKALNVSLGNKNRLLRVNEKNVERN